MEKTKKLQQEFEDKLKETGIRYLDKFILDEDGEILYKFKNGDIDIFYSIFEDGAFLFHNLKEHIGYDCNIDTAIDKLKTIFKSNT